MLRAVAVLKAFCKVALQDPPAGSQKLGAFSVLSLANVRAPKLVASDAPAVAVAMPPGNAERALVTVSDRARGSFGAFLVRTPNLQVDFTSLPSEPLASGRSARHVRKE